MFISLLKHAHLTDSLWWKHDISPSFYDLNAFLLISNQNLPLHTLKPISYLPFCPLLVKVFNTTSETDILADSST